MPRLADICPQQLAIRIHAEIAASIFRRMIHQVRNYPQRRSWRGISPRRRRI